MTSGVSHDRADETPEAVLEDEITIFSDWVRIDAQSRMPGIEFEVAWPDREEMEYRAQKSQVVSRQDLIASKRAAGREGCKSGAELHA
jgi:hypothetical protein